MKLPMLFPMLIPMQFFKNKSVAKLLLVALLSFGSVPTLLADVTEVDNQSLEELIAAGVPVVDVRRLDEWQKTGVIEGSHTLTFFDRLGRYDAEKWLSELDKIVGKGEPVVLICHSGVRSKTISNLLDKRAGYTSVHNHTRGIADWIKSGKPVVKHEPAAASNGNDAGTQGDAETEAKK